VDGMASTIYQRFRRDVGLAADDIAGLPDEDIDDLLEEAGESYTAAAAKAAYARVLYLQGKLAAASEEVDYVENESEEDASDRFEHYLKLLTRWEKKLDDVAGVNVAIFEVY
jgi:hypothetical protein